MRASDQENSRKVCVQNYTIRYHLHTLCLSIAYLPARQRAPLIKKANKTRVLIMLAHCFTSMDLRVKGLKWNTKRIVLLMALFRQPANMISSQHLISQLCCSSSSTAVLLANNFLLSLLAQWGMNDYPKSYLPVATGALQEPGASCSGAGSQPAKRKRAVYEDLCSRRVLWCYNFLAILWNVRLTAVLFQLTWLCLGYLFYYEQNNKWEVSWLAERLLGFS